MPKIRTDHIPWSVFLFNRQALHTKRPWIIPGPFLFKEKAMTTAPELASLNDAAARYKCNPRTIRRMIARGDLTGYRVGPKLLRIDIREADRVFTASADDER